jgi:citrate lyase subunit beta/citryl-CoA lyase
MRSAVVVASAAAGVESPTGPASTDFRDLERLRTDTEGLLRMGFGARSAIHPAQVPVINEVFTPGEEEVARATRLVELHDEHRASGTGTFVDDEGRMVDEAVVRAARRTLSRRR